MRYGLALVLVPAFANAGVTYDLTLHPLAGQAGEPTVVHYFVDQDLVRVDDSVFKAGTVYVIDSVHRTVRVLPNATLDALQEQMAKRVKETGDLAKNATPEKHEMAEKLAALVREMYERQRQGVPREFRLTDRTETVGHESCRIWEEFEQGMKRLELCVAPTAAIAGGEEILRGMKNLCRYIYGAGFAFGVQFGPPDVWPHIEKLRGVPVRVREFKDGVAISESTLTSGHERPVDATLFEVPEGYSRKETANGYAVAPCIGRALPRTADP